MALRIGFMAQRGPALFLLLTLWASVEMRAFAVSLVTQTSASPIYSRAGSQNGSILPTSLAHAATHTKPLACLRCLFPGGVRTPDASDSPLSSRTRKPSSHSCPLACRENGVRIPIVASPVALSHQLQCFIAPGLSAASRCVSHPSLKVGGALSSYVHTGVASSLSLNGAYLSHQQPRVFKLNGSPLLLSSPSPLSSSHLNSVAASDGRLAVSDGINSPGASASSPDGPQFPASAPSSPSAVGSGTSASVSPPTGSPSPSAAFSPFSNAASPSQYGASSAPLPAPAEPIYPTPLTADTSLTGRRMEIDPTGPLGQMQALLREGIYKAGPYIQDWPHNEERDVDMLVTKLDETAAISPGQKTVIQLPFRERDRMVRHMRATRSATIFLGYVDYREEGDVEIARPQENRSALAGSPPNSQGTKDDYMLIGYGAIAEPTEIHMLDKSGELGLRIMGRVKIVSVLEASELSFRVRVVPHKDESKRDGFVNPLVSRENIKALYSLYDRVNKMELHFRKLEGKMHQAHLVSLRPSLEDKVDEFINETSGATEQDIGEWVSFCAMDHHIDARARCWAMAQQDTELRLDVVRRSLEDKLRQLQAEVKRLKDQPGFRDPDDVKAPISEQMPLNIKL
ncbi:conserved hypothetical protein [Neospora caninum Liverpool]|uniref:Transmembrane protein n=1 Tax=Neospora caninum (strain Liverpool) TaxID=572307 RepID=F0VDP5_NEOCL|nr:conserved hypothetical protein [Neospora caninum Liverpool]CBZ51838.1 conserved hypothetical protein [Neospora caninum Liverpool]CEL65796.1 TPA: hypothetical protein BN1204_016300 [Neospora caninum Liverpool]|eukprot:XP_003881871.1 conserved hypothetical protein [Neospora caninum Liverpool]